jgi:hypothetical protein
MVYFLPLQIKVLAKIIFEPNENPKIRTFLKGLGFMSSKALYHPNASLNEAFQILDLERLGWTTRICRAPGSDRFFGGSPKKTWIGAYSWKFYSPMLIFYKLLQIHLKWEKPLYFRRNIKERKLPIINDRLSWLSFIQINRLSSIIYYDIYTL